MSFSSLTLVSWGRVASTSIFRCLRRPMSTRLLRSYLSRPSPSAGQLGVTINYAPNRAVRYNLKGKTIEVLSEAVQLGGRLSLYRLAKKTCLCGLEGLLDCGKYHNLDVKYHARQRQRRML